MAIELNEEQLGKLLDYFESNKKPDSFLLFSTARKLVRDILIMRGYKQIGPDYIRQAQQFNNWDKHLFSGKFFLYLEENGPPISLIYDTWILCRTVHL